MADARREARLVEEHRRVDRIARELVLELLHDDELLEATGPSGLREVNDAHAATRKLCKQSIAS